MRHEVEIEILRLRVRASGLCVCACVCPGAAVAPQRGADGAFRPARWKTQLLTNHSTSLRKDTDAINDLT